MPSITVRMNQTERPPRIAAEDALKPRKKHKRNADLAKYADLAEYGEARGGVVKGAAICCHQSTVLRVCRCGRHDNDKR